MTAIKVDPGHGYRLLDDDEEAIEGDGYLTLNSQGTALFTPEEWHVVWGLAGQTHNSHGLIAFRRKVKSTPLDQHFI